MQETRVQTLGQQDPLEKEMQPTPVLLPGKFHGLRSLVGYGVAKSQTRLSDFTFHFFTESRTGKPGVLQTLGSESQTRLRA